MEGFEITAKVVKEWLENPAATEPRKRDVQQYRAKLLDTARAINASANMTDAQKRDFEGLMKKADYCNEAIRRLDFKEQIDRAECEKNGNAVFGGNAQQSGPFLRSGDRLSQKYQPTQRGNFAGLVRGIVTGDTRNMPEGVRAMAVGGGAGYTCPEEFSASIIDLARNKSALFRSGAALFLPMGAEQVRIPRMITGPVAEWHVENAPLSGSEPSFGATFLQAKTLACLVTMSVELFEDSAGLDAFLENAMAEALAAEIDRAAIVGTGTGGSPGGILIDPDVQTYDLQSAAFPTYGDIMSMSGLLDEENAPEGRTYLVNPKINTLIDLAVDGTGNYLYQIPVAAAKLKRLVTNQIPTGITAGGSSLTSPIIMTAPESCCFGLRTNLSVEVSRTSGDSFKNMQVQLRAYWRGDFGILRPKHICYSTGIKYE